MVVLAMGNRLHQKIKLSHAHTSRRIILAGIPNLLQKERGRCPLLLLSYISGFQAWLVARVNQLSLCHVWRIDQVTTITLPLQQIIALTHLSTRFIDPVFAKQ